MKQWDGAEYSESSNLQNQLARDAIKNRLPGLQPDRVLDVGCGDGKTTRRVLSKFPDADLLAIDASQSMIRQAQENNQDTYNRISFRQQNALEMNYSDEFDLITSFSALHWIPDHETLLDNFAKALKSGGQTFLHFGGKGNVKRLMDVAEEMVQSNPWNQWVDQTSPDLKFHSRSEYRELLDKSPLEIKRLERLEITIHHETREEFFNWIKSSAPYVDQLPPEQKTEFVDQYVETYLERIEHGEGPIPVKMVRLEAELYLP